MAEPVKLIVRLPETVHARIKAFAEEDHRSLNGEIIYVLEQYAIARDKEAARQATASTAGEE